MDVPRCLYVVDGENLVFRFQDMIKAGRVPRDSSAVIHEPDVLVWATSLVHDVRYRMVRATYYTSAVGDESRIRHIASVIQQLTYTTYLDRVDSGLFYHSVFKREKGFKSRAVDINITIDALRHSYQNDIDELFLVTGDSDFVPLVRAIMRLGKRVHVLSLSSGLSDALRLAPDTHQVIDTHFFLEPPPQPPRTA